MKAARARTTRAVHPGTLQGTAPFALILGRSATGRALVGSLGKNDGVLALTKSPNTDRRPGQPWLGTKTQNLVSWGSAGMDPSSPLPHPSPS